MHFGCTCSLCSGLGWRGAPEEHEAPRVKRSKHKAIARIRQEAMYCVGEWRLEPRARYNISM